MTDHPSPETIRGYVDSTLAPEVRQEIEAHLLGCESCLKAVEELFGNQPFSRSLREIPSADVLPTPAASNSAGSPPEPPVELRSHPRYEVLSFIGTGGMGQVWRARHLLMNRIVALKVINPDFLRSFAARERFVREVRAAALLSHPNIVQAFDAEQVGELNFLVMEFVEGSDLARVVRERGRLPVAEACEYARQAADGLQHAHERGMIHRDVKPHNLMLTPTGQIKILDFGLSAILAEPDPDLPAEPQATTIPGGSITRLGDGCGTPDYISPEQVRDARTADTRSDIYSLGCTLSHLLTGSPPFPGGTGYSKIAGHLERTPPSIRSICPDVPLALVAVLDRMLAKERRKRFATPAEVSAALSSFAAGGTPTDRKRTWRRRAFLTAGVVGIGGGIAYSVWGRQQPPKPVFAEELLKLEGHTDAVHSVALIPGNRAALSCGEDMTVRHWSLETGTLLHTLEGHTDWVAWVVAHPDGRHAISGGRDRFVIVWDLVTGKSVQRIEASREPILCVAISPDGKQLLSAGGTAPVLWNFGSNAPLRTLEGANQAWQFIRFVSGNRALGGGDSKQAVLWNLDSGRALVRFPHEHSVEDGMLSDDGTLLYTACRDRTTRVWDVASGQEVKRMRFDDLPYRVIVRDGKPLVFCPTYEGLITLRELESGREVCRFVGHTLATNAVVVDPDARLVLTGNRDRTVRLWSFERG